MTGTPPPPTSQPTGLTPPTSSSANAVASDKARITSDPHLKTLTHRLLSLCNNSNITAADEPTIRETLQQIIAHVTAHHPTHYLTAPIIERSEQNVAKAIKRIAQQKPPQQQTFQPTSLPLPPQQLTQQQPAQRQQRPAIPTSTVAPLQNPFAPATSSTTSAPVMHNPFDMSRTTLQPSSGPSHVAPVSLLAAAITKPPPTHNPFIAALQTAATTPPVTLPQTQTPTPTPALTSTLIAASSDVGDTSRKRSTIFVDEDENDTSRFEAKRRRRLDTVDEDDVGNGNSRAESNGSGSGSRGGISIADNDPLFPTRNNRAARDRLASAVKTNFVSGAHALSQATATGAPPRAVGLSRPTQTHKPFKPPFATQEKSNSHNTASQSSSSSVPGLSDIPESLLAFDSKLVDTILKQIRADINVSWDDISGLQQQKSEIMEEVIDPFLRPDLFSGACEPVRGILLYGPPGSGKTMLARAMASQCQATFFSVTASSLTSKWHGEGEKLVTALFACAEAYQPSIVFIDEMDSLLSERTDGEFEASRRIKNQLFIEMDGIDSHKRQRLLVIGATNLINSLDGAARRRLPLQIYIPLPDLESRCALIRSLIQRDQVNRKYDMSEGDISTIASQCDGMSCSSMTQLFKVAARGPLRRARASGAAVAVIDANSLTPVTMIDFQTAVDKQREATQQNVLEQPNKENQTKKVQQSDDGTTGNKNNRFVST